MSKYNFIKISFVILVLCTFTEKIFSQSITYYTPEGQEVTGRTEEVDDYTWDQDYWINNIIDYYTLDATPISNECDGSYNCHGYAWVMTEGTGLPGWIKHNEELKYIEDASYSNDGVASYIETNASNATHTMYDPNLSDHSTRVIKNSYPISSSGSQTHVSKWGEGPLVRHAPGHDYYALKNTSIINYYKLKTTHSGVLSTNPKTWIGAGGQTHTITSDVTVPSGGSLTIQAGATLVFQNGSELKVYGALNVNGTSSNKVTFDFGSPNSYNGIKFYPGSSGTVENAVINDAYYGVYVSSVSPTIKNCEISDCTYGIYTSYASPTIETNKIHDVYRGIFTYLGSPVITDNYIYNASDYGILVNASDTFIRENTIKNCKGGIWAYGLQTIKLHGYGRNKIEGYESGGHAVYVTGGTAYLGEYHSRGYNSFIYNSLNTVVYNSSTNEVLAEKNYWGSTIPTTQNESDFFYGDVEWSFPLSTPISGVGSTLGKTIEPDLTPDRALFSEAIALVDNNKNKEASKKFKELINDYPDSRFAGLSVAWAMASDKKEKEFKNQSSYLHSLKDHTNKNVRDNHFLWLASLEARNGNIEASKLVANSTPIDETVGVEIRLNLANDMLNLYNDEQGAEVIFNELIFAGASESTLQTIDVIKETAHYLSNFSFREGSIAKEVVGNVEVNESALSIAYPNPFNPTTTISYQIPKDGFVNLVVYNTLGQVIAELVNEYQTGGKYSVQFNATGLSSGVYFYKLESGRFSKVSKMLLLR